jgi:N-hydroxyarylamine O-acetyltransferase
VVDVPLDLEAYFRRVGYAGPREVGPAVLAALTEAHASTIPFENLDILLGKRILLDLASLQAKLVSGRRGGYCFEQNTLFSAVLRLLGFRVTPLAARVRSGAPAGAVRPRTHMLLAVDLPDGRYLADVGFGGDGPLRPLRLAAGEETMAGLSRFRLRREGPVWVLEGDPGDGWRDLYAFTEEPQEPVDFEVANWFTSTWPTSPFVTGLVAQRQTPRLRAMLRDRELTLRDGEGVRTETIGDAGRLVDVLGERFGLSFPPGTRFSAPSFPA